MSEIFGQPALTMSANSVASYGDGLSGPGNELRAISEEMLECASALKTELGGELTTLIDNLCEQVLAQSFRIAVIGQVKSGKSSLLNTFVQKPEMLPTDVNPWTAVITRVHFGTAHENDGARFQFFSEDEWRHIVGGGPLRKLAERALPDFDAAALHQQLADLEARAKNRLGDQYPELLGKHHLFSSVTPNVVERYVTAGDRTAGADSADFAGKFADITKSADLYFRQSPLGFPTMFIDTPGTNDPFLVRDQITLQNLEQADMYIVVVTAQQPLSTTDLKLLRLLQGVQPDRIVVFVNRIDMLGDIARDTQNAFDRIRRILHKEFSESEVPIIAGSAWWGISAAAPSKAELARILTPAFAAYAEHLGVATAAEIKQLQDTPGPPPIRMREVLHACSGLHQLGDMVTRLLLRSVAADTIFDAAEMLAGLAGNAASLGHQKVRRSQVKAVSGDSAEGDETANARHRLGTQAKTLSAELNQFEKDLQRHARRALNDLARRMRICLDTFIEHEGRKLSQQAKWRSQFPRLAVDTINLRHRVAQEFMTGYKEAADKLAELESAWTPKLDALMAEAIPDAGLSLHLGRKPKPPALPSLAPLGQAVAFDLDNTPLSRANRGNRNPQQAVAEFESLIREEFVPIIDALIAAAQETFSNFIKSIMRRNRTVSREMFSALDEMLRWPPEHMGSARHSAMEAQAERLDALSARLNALCERCAELRAKSG